MLSIRKIIINVALWLVVGLIVGELYWQSLRIGTLEPVVAAGLVTTILALGLGLFWLKNLSWEPLKLARDLKWWILSLSPLLLAGIAALLSSTLGDPRTTGLNIVSFWPQLLWIPVVEEILYRGVLSYWFRRRSTLFMGAYGSALVFSLMHAGFTWRSVLEWDILIPLGPLLLAWCCEYIFIKTNRLCFCIAFHAACNGTVVVFQSLDSRWLHWLEILYLKG